MSKIWGCKIGECESVPDGADLSMRQAVAKAYREITGQDAQFNFSGWGAELSEPERAVVENREPSAEYEREWHAKNTAPSEIAALKRDAAAAVLAEREACAEDCSHKAFLTHTHDDFGRGRERGLLDACKLIRARGKA